jgi:hypothetical protein
VQYALVLGLVLLVSGMLIAAAPSPTTPIKFTAIDFPGATLTRVFGINPGGEVVGVYKDTSGAQHGFLLSGGNYITIDYPGAMATMARGIGPGGEIVGSYTNAPGGAANMHGFLLSQGVFTEIQFPGYLGTIAQRIGPNGDIYGCNHNTNTSSTMHGMVRTADGYSQIDVPASMHNGATPDGGTIIGVYTNLATQATHGYFLINGAFLPFDVPGSTYTDAYDINPQGEVVGTFRDSTGHFHGYERSRRGDFTAIDVPDSIETDAFGINPGGDIVGYYVDANGKSHGFLRSRGN